MNKMRPGFTALALVVTYEGVLDVIAKAQISDNASRLRQFLNAWAPRPIAGHQRFRQLGVPSAELIKVLVSTRVVILVQEDNIPRLAVT
jgi:hypothetical protein